MRIGIVILVCLLAFAFTAPCLFAEEAGYQTKLKNGFTNIFTSFLEIPRQIKNVTVENDPVAGITYGTVKGLAFMFSRILVGTFDIVTCPFAPYDEPLIEPNFEL